jgi:hypothetical protein
LDDDIVDSLFVMVTDVYSNNRELVFAGSPVLAQLLLNGIGVQPLISLQLMSLSLSCSQGHRDSSSSGVDFVFRLVLVLVVNAVVSSSTCCMINQLFGVEAWLYTRVTGRQMMCVA